MSDNKKPKLSAREIDALLSDDVDTSLLEDTPADFMHTQASRTIISRLDSARRNHYPFVLVSGPAGSGKSMTVREYARDKDIGYIRCYPDFGPSELIQELLAYLSITDVKSWRLRYSLTAQTLKQRYRMVIFDEAQLMSRKTLEAAKYLTEDSNATFVLVMTDEFVGALRGWRDVDSRTGVAATVSPLSLDEFRALYDQSGFSAESLDEIHTLTGGIMRDIARLLRLVDEFCAINAEHSLSRDLMTPSHLRVIAAKLNLRGSK